jgi:hypothetical protein
MFVNLLFAGEKISVLHRRPYQVEPALAGAGSNYLHFSLAISLLA